MTVAIIPARGGSKRIPRKNIKDFAGRPMIAHSIACAISRRAANGTKPGFLRTLMGWARLRLH